MNQKIALFDIDYPLFDTTAYKKNIASQLSKVFSQIDPQKAYDMIDAVYYDVRSFGSFDPSLFADIFMQKFPEVTSKEIVENIWWQKDLLISALYPETIPVLEILSKKENLI